MIIKAEFTLPDGAYLKEFNDWYSLRHVADFLPSPGVVSARRFYRRTGDRVRFIAVYEHDGSCAPRETFASAPALESIRDFERQWQDRTGPPTIEVYHEIGVGDAYRGWPPPRFGTAR